MCHPAELFWGKWENCPRAVLEAPPHWAVGQCGSWTSLNSFPGHSCTEGVVKPAEKKGGMVGRDRHKSPVLFHNTLTSPAISFTSFILAVEKGHQSLPCPSGRSTWTHIQISRTQGKWTLQELSLDAFIKSFWQGIFVCYLIFFILFLNILVYQVRDTVFCLVLGLFRWN